MAHFLQKGFSLVLSIVGKNINYETETVSLLLVTCCNVTELADSLSFGTSRTQAPHCIGILDQTTDLTSIPKFPCLYCLLCEAVGSESVAQCLT